MARSSSFWIRCSHKPALAYNSVLTTIRVLERKGYVKHSKDGRAHVYAPLVGREDATRSEISHLVGRFFKNSHEQLVLNILEDKGIGAGGIGATARDAGTEWHEMIWPPATDHRPGRKSAGFSNSLPEGILIALFAAAMLRLLPRQNSGTRFAVWFVALLSVAALPFAGWSMMGRLREILFRLPVAAHPLVSMPESWGMALFLAWLSGSVCRDITFGDWTLAAASRCGRVASRSTG